MPKEVIMNGKRLPGIMGVISAFPTNSGRVSITTPREMVLPIWRMVLTVAAATP